MAQSDTKRRKPKEEDIPGPSVLPISGKGEAWKLLQEKRDSRPDQDAD